MFITNSAIEADSLHFWKLHLGLSIMDCSAKFLSRFYSNMAPSQR